MLNEELKTKLTELFPAVVFEESAEPTAADDLKINIASGDWLNFARLIREEETLHFDYLFCLTCIDWKTHLTMVYYLSSTKFRHQVVVKSTLDNTKPEIETVSHIWKTAELNEREVYEMYGVNFLHHPDLRLLILPDGWEGKNPMRKDFEDAVNMIKL